MKLNDLEYLDGDPVTIHSLGPLHGDKTYRGIVVGVSVDYGKHPATIYIILAVDPLDDEYRYSCYCMPSACMRIGWYE